MTWYSSLRPLHDFTPGSDILDHTPTQPGTHMYNDAPSEGSQAPILWLLDNDPDCNDPSYVRLTRPILKWGKKKMNDRTA